MTNDNRRGRGGGNRGGRYNRDSDYKPPDSSTKVTASPEVMETFGNYQKELDEKHDRMERIIKSARDVTIESKRIIFQLHRITTESDKDVFLDKSFGRLNQLRNNHFRPIAEELLNEDHYCFLRGYTFGLQEFIEALSLYYFLKEERLVSWSEVRILLSFPEPHEDDESYKLRRVEVPLTDYLLGVGDLGGELMRYAINSVSAGDIDAPKRVTTFMRSVHGGFSLLGNTVSSKEFSLKSRVLRQSLLKVEYVLYVLHLRASEVPKHMLADVVYNSSRALAEQEREIDDDDLM